ncbi:MAG: hypothetical protein CMC12_00910 [Flavobacteriaceae bacterium]|jgi:hypothetical protein|nr:hypothetical protein [Flavobacteriaceae bacterium]|tara:strand:+ start:1157 stop:1606 length:450 start_codon:yes stop_codon:yes gene_type:complete
MKLENIIKIVCAVLGLLGVIFLFRILATGDDDIKMAASMGDFSLISPLISLSMFILFITVAVTIIFSLINLASNPGKLKKSMIFIGFLIIVIGIAYASSTGVETPMKDGQVLSASGSKWVGTGIRVFYILASVAVLSMIAFGARNIIKK